MSQNTFVKKIYKVPKEPKTASQVAEIKAFLSEKTDSKTIIWIINWGYGRLFGKK
jgi:hypothetical protein